LLVDGTRIAFQPYTDSQLVKLDVRTFEQHVAETPRVLHASTGISFRGDAAFFHEHDSGPGRIRRWNSGGAVEVVAAYAGSLRGIRGGRVLAREPNGFTIVEPKLTGDQVSVFRTSLKARPRSSVLQRADHMCHRRVRHPAFDHDHPHAAHAVGAARDSAQLPHRQEGVRQRHAIAQDREERIPWRLELRPTPPRENSMSTRVIHTLPIGLRPADPAGRFRVEIEMRSSAWEQTIQSTSRWMHVQPASIDQFVHDLERMELAVGQTVRLDCSRQSAATLDRALTPAS
jgi:hypothetical protein